MANPEHVEILKKGVEEWNRWRIAHPVIRPDLSNEDFSGANLRGANLHGADLSDVDLIRADISSANFSAADISGADLGYASLFFTIFKHANMQDTELNAARLGETVFTNVDLSEAVNLETCEHWGPSSIDFRTLQQSWPLPRKFLQGVGFPDNFIEYLPSLIAPGAIQYYTSFISYSRINEEFVERLHADLQDKGVRCWLDTKDMPIGARIRQTIDEAIRQREKMIVVLSETSIDSDWVEDEVEASLEEEKRRGTNVLMPIRIDKAVMETDKAWAAKLRRQRNIGDFAGWKDHDHYQKAFKKLLKWLKYDK